MYNFEEIASLSELKELCFYIKAINEAQVDVNNYSNMGQVKDHLKDKYNLEISFSKLYLFVEKIYYQLPISETDERLTKIESTLSEINADLSIIKNDIIDLKTRTDDLADIGARIGTDTAFKNLGTVIGLLTGKSPNTNFSLATGLADSLTFINDDFKHVHTSIYAYLDHISAFLADELGYKKPSL